ncbi:MAG: plasmid pRiA4b ORF-3 family protein [Cryomorphaceae bacterium]|nr:plasmid pRiA4b ORF-3 family protein [Cryomorphaceae bacterium]
MALFSLMVTLDDERNNVLRQLVVDGDQSLFDLHNLLVDYFDLSKGEMASFYHVEGEWETTEEIPMEVFDPKVESQTMFSINIEDVFSRENRLVYVYDFIALWTFFIERVKLAEDVSQPGLVASIGELPETPPAKTFMGNDFPSSEDFEDEDEDEDAW